MGEPYSLLERVPDGWLGPTPRIVCHIIPLLVTGGGALASHAWGLAAVLLTLGPILYLTLHRYAIP